LRGERDDLDALGASRDRRAAEEDGEAEEVARLTPPRRIAEGLEVGARRRVGDADLLGVVEVGEDGEAGVVVLDLGRGHELAQPQDVEVDLWMGRRSPE